MITRIKAINFLSRQKNQIFQGGSEVFLRKYNLFLKKLFSSFFYLIGSPISLMIFISIRLIQPFYLIRMQQIFSHRLGHHTVDTEIYLLEKGRRENIPKKKYLDIWYNSNTISNKYLSKMWSRKLIIAPRRIMKTVYSLNKIIPGGDVHNIYKNHRTFNANYDEDFSDMSDYRQKTIYYNPYFDNSKPHLSFTPKEEKRGEAKLRAMGIPQGSPFVVLIVRDSAYLSHQNVINHLDVSWAYHDYRDCNVQNYVLAAKELADRGYYVIRMGQMVKEPMDVDHPMIIDYATNGMRTDFMDIYLGAKCTFCISNGTGYEGIPYIFRKPILFVDHVPLGDINTYNAKHIIVTKKHWSKTENRFLTFQEIFDSAANYQKTEQFENSNIDLIESSPEEIQDVVIEMDERLKGTWESSEEDELLQEKFWKHFPNGMENFAESYQEVRSRMGTSFLRNYEKLLNEPNLIDYSKYNREHKGDELGINESHNEIPLSLSLLQKFSLNRNLERLNMLSRTFSSFDFNRITRFLMKVWIELISLLLIPFGLISYAFILLINPWVRIRIGKFQSERIGHLSANMELYLCEKEMPKEKKSNRQIDLWYHGYPISNKQLAKMWNRILYVFPRIFLAPLDNVISLISHNNIHRISEYENFDTDRDVNNFLDNSEPHLSFTPKEEERGEAKLRAMGVPQGSPFVVLIVRDSAYLEKKLPWRSWAYHDYRDCNVQNYVLAAKELADRGYYVIRMGQVVKEAMDVDHPMIIDYATNGMRTDFMDIYLGAKCTFCISNGTGYDGVPTIFRKPILFVDHVPLLAISTFSSNILITTKKHWLHKEQRYMTFNEIISATTLNNHNPYQLHEKLDIDLIESSPEEIQDVVIEMDERLKGTWESSEEDELLQEKFWKHFPSDFEVVALGHGAIRSRMGARFLKDSEKLLDD